MLMAIIANFAALATIAAGQIGHSLVLGAFLCYNLPLKLYKIYR